MESEDENVAAIKGSAMVYCTECGFANEQGNAFCSQCGSPLEQPEANPAAPASPEPPAGRPGVDHTKAVVIVLIALIWGFVRYRLMYQNHLHCLHMKMDPLLPPKEHCNPYIGQ